MFENFTDGARKAIALANQEAHRLDHDHIDTGHMLLGLMRGRTGPAADVLVGLGIGNERRVSAVLAEIAPPGPPRSLPGKLPQTPDAKRALLFAIDESRALAHDHVGTEHLLLGLMRVDGGVAVRAVDALGTTADAVRAKVLDAIGTRPPADGQTATATVTAAGRSAADLLRSAAAVLEAQAGRLRELADTLDRGRLP